MGKGKNNVPAWRSKMGGQPSPYSTKGGGMKKQNTQGKKSGGTTVKPKIFRKK